MGSAKLPEQINSRIEEGLRDAKHKPDPIIEELKSRPVSRIIETEERNVRLPQTPASKTRSRSVADRLALNHQLKGLYARIDTLRSADPKVFAEPTAVDELLRSLKQRANEIRRKLSQTPKKRRKS